MMQSSSKLSVGLIVRSTTIWRWQARLIERLLASGVLDIKEVLVLDEKSSTLPGVVATLHKLDSMIFRSESTDFERVGLELPNANVVNVDLDTKHYDHYAALDLLLNFSECVVDDKLKRASKLGLLETHFSKQTGVVALDSRKVGFSQLAANHKQNYFSIVAHCPDDVAFLLTESHPSFNVNALSRNLNQYWKLLEVSWLRVCKHLQLTTPERFPAVKAYCVGSGDTSGACSDVKSINAYRNLANVFLSKFNQKFIRKEQWVLLLQFRDTNAQAEEMPLSFGDYIELTPPEDCFWADPFVISDSGKHYVFFEELPFATERGHLSCMEVYRDGTHSPPQVILKKPYHLSYPNVFAYGSAHYMIPESGDASVIELYKSTAFPYQWEHQQTLMEGLHAYDSTLIEHGGRWWLFACIAAEKGMSGCEELHIFSADSPLSQSWVSHPLNPIISDASRARPAGKFFVHEGDIYRPSQNCAGSYGAGLNINQVKILNGEQYQEELIYCARPDWDSRLTALHTLNFNRHVSVADAMRVENRLF